MRPRIVLAALALFLLPASARADPLVFSDVRLALTNPAGGTTFVDLFESRGLTIEHSESIASLFITLTGTLPPGGSDLLRIRVTATNEAGTFVITNPNPESLDIPIPVSGSIFPPVTVVTGFQFPASTTGTLLSIDIDLLNSSPDYVIPSGPNAGQRVDSFTFVTTVAQPIPEPATLLLLGTGLTGVVGAARGRRRAARSSP